MESIDIIILLLLLWGAIQGWRHGLFKEVVSSVGFFVGLYIAYKFYAHFGDRLAPLLSENPSIGKYVAYFVAFIGLWIVVPLLLGFAATVITKSLKSLHMGGLNTLLGMLVGVVKYFVLLSCILCALNLLGFIDPQRKARSVFYEPVVSVANYLFEHKEKLFPRHLPAIHADTLWVPITHTPQ